MATRRRFHVRGNARSATVALIRPRPRPTSSLAACRSRARRVIISGDDASRWALERTEGGPARTLKPGRPAWATCYSGRSVPTTRGPCGVPSAVYSHASRSSARNSRMRLRSRADSSGARTSNRPRSSRTVQTKKASQRQSSMLAHATLGRQSRNNAGSPQSGHALRCRRRTGERLGALDGFGESMHAKLGRVRPTRQDRPGEKRLRSGWDLSLIHI